jgi:hypothetical protein
VRTGETLTEAELEIAFPKEYDRDDFKKKMPVLLAVHANIERLIELELIGKMKLDYETKAKSTGEQDGWVKLKEQVLRLFSESESVTEVFKGKSIEQTLQDLHQKQEKLSGSWDFGNLAEKDAKEMAEKLLSFFNQLDDQSNAYDTFWTMVKYGKELTFDEIYDALKPESKDKPEMKELVEFVIKVKKERIKIGEYASIHQRIKFFEEIRTAEAAADKGELTARQKFYALQNLDVFPFGVTGVDGVQEKLQNAKIMKKISKKDDTESTQLE